MTIDAPSRELRIEWIGSIATRFLATTRSARVAAVFERSIYLEAEERFLCLGTGIGNGPLNAVLASDAAPGWSSRFRSGMGFSLAGGTASSAGVTIRFDTARSWQPPQWPEPAAPDRLREALDAARAFAAIRAPSDGLMRLALPPSSAMAETPLSRIARPRILKLHRWLETRLAGTRQLLPPVDLLGAGPGLTPSGDDLLCAVLLSLQSMGAQAMAGELADGIDAGAARATTPLSAAFLASAAEGMGSEPLHAFIAAIVAGRTAAVAQVMTDLSRVGHTSGWDAMAGGLMALTAAAEARALRAPRSP